VQVGRAHHLRDGAGVNQLQQAITKADAAHGAIIIVCMRLNLKVASAGGGA
jgi:hypothetical protein